LILSQRITKVVADTKSDPLVVGDAKVLPSASRQFRNGQKLIFYFDIYNAKSSDAHSNVDVALSLARDGKAVPVKLPTYKINQPLKGESFRIPVAKYLELAGLPAGNYSLIVSARDQNGGASTTARSAFTIVN